MSSIKPVLIYGIFILYFASEGVIYPFWPVWLGAHGLDNAKIALVIAASYWPQTVVAISLAYISDLRSSQLLYAGVASFFSSVCFIIFSTSGHLSLFIALSILFGGAWASVLPLAESKLLQFDKESTVNYGLVRASGSFSFIILSILVGYVIKYTGIKIVPISISFFMLMTGCVSCVLHMLVKRRGTDQSKQTPPRIALIFSNRWLVAGAISGALIQLSHALYFAVSSNAWLRSGYSTFSVGIFWAIAVISEIILFSFSNVILQKISPKAVIVTSGLCACVRWLLFSVSIQIYAICIGQVLHALSFAAYHIAMMRIFRDWAPNNAKAIVQGLYYSVLVALPVGICTPLFGYLFDRIGQTSYLLASLIAFCGAACAMLALPHSQRKV